MKKLKLESMAQTMKSYILLGIILLSVGGIVQGQSIVTSPTDVSEIVGGTATFTCKIVFYSSEEMTWQFDGTIIFSSHFDSEDYPLGNQKYTVKRDKGNFTLEVQGLTIADGGKYACSTITTTASAVLLVLGTPVIHFEPSNPVEGDTVVFKCAADFGGPSAHFMYKSILQLAMSFEDAYSNEAFTDSNITQLGNHYQISQVYSIEVDAGFDQKKVFCQISTTLLGYNATCNILLTVLYPVQNVSYTPVKKEYEVGSNILCTADSNPQPYILWENNNEAGHIIRSKWLNVTSGMTGKNEWICTAKNMIQDKVYEKIAMITFTVVDNAYGMDIIKYTVITILVVALLLAGISLFVVWKKKNRRTQAEKENKVQSEESESLLQMCAQQGELLPQDQAKKIEVTKKNAPHCGARKRLSKRKRNVISQQPVNSSEYYFWTTTFFNIAHESNVTYSSRGKYQ